MGRTRNCEPEIEQPPIIIRFVSRYKRNQVYVSRFKSKKLGYFLIENMESLFINKNLTQKRNQLFWQTKQKAKDVDYTFYWNFNGQIFVHKNEENDKSAC